MNIRVRLRQACGLDPEPAVLEHAVRTRMAQRGMHDRAQYADAFDDEELQQLIDLVVVPESWLFREPAAFAAATDHVRQRLAAQPSRILRILCVPCAGGEEAYSMAIALHDAGIAPQAYRIEGVDVSAAAIKRARSARYTANAFRGQGLTVRERWFSSRDGGEFALSETLRGRVAFSQGNLLDLAEPCPYDIVFCRNLLIYFDEPTVARAIAVLHALLADDGVLFSGYAEVPLFVHRGFLQHGPAATFALRKAPAPAEQATEPAPLPRPPQSRASARVRPGPDPGPAPTPALPDFHDARDLLAHARNCADAGDLRAAEAACSTLLSRDPGCAEAWFTLGQVRGCEGDVQAAATHWRRCLYLEPDHYEALCSLALLVEQAGDAAQGAALRTRAARRFARGGGIAGGRQ